MIVKIVTMCEKAETSPAPIKAGLAPEGLRFDLTQRQVRLQYRRGSFQAAAATVPLRQLHGTPGIIFRQ